MKGLHNIKPTAGRAALVLFLFLAATGAARAQQYAEVTSTILNFRSSPEVAADNKIGEFRKGDLMLVLAPGAEWVQVQSSAGVRGWVAGRHLHILERRAVDVDELNIRSSPKVAADNRLAAMPRGTLVMVRETDKDWSRVITRTGVQGWVASRHLSPVKEAYVNIDNLNFRSSPEIAAHNIIDRLARDSLVQIVAERGDWTGIRTAEGIEGWVAERYLVRLRPGELPPSLTPPPPRELQPLPPEPEPIPPVIAAEPQPAPPPRVEPEFEIEPLAQPVHAVVTATELNIRSAPELEPENVVGTLERDDEVVIFQRSGAWTNIRTVDGRQGWVAGVYLSAPYRGEPETLLTMAQDIFSQIRLLSGGAAAQRQDYFAKLFEAAVLTREIINDHPGFQRLDEALLLAGKIKCCEFDAPAAAVFLEEFEDEFEFFEPLNKYYYTGADFRRLLREHPQSRLAEDAAFALALLPRGVECEGLLECHLAYDINPLVPFLENHPDSSLVEDAVFLLSHDTLAILDAILDLERKHATQQYTYDPTLVRPIIDKLAAALEPIETHRVAVGLHILGDVYARLGEPDRAKDYYDRILALGDGYHGYERVKFNRSVLDLAPPHSRTPLPDLKLALAHFDPKIRKRALEVLEQSGLNGLIDSVKNLTMDPCDTVGLQALKVLHLYDRAAYRSALDRLMAIDSRGPITPITFLRNRVSEARSLFGDE